MKIVDLTQRDLYSVFEITWPDSQLSNPGKVVGILEEIHFAGSRGTTIVVKVGENLITLGALWHCAFTKIS